MVKGGNGRTDELTFEQPEEIAFAKSLNKEIFYLENPQSDDEKEKL